MGASAGGSAAVRRRGTASRPTPWRHLGAMHLSGAVLLFTFVLPPMWLVDAYYAAPPDDPTAGSPLALLFIPPLVVCFHVLVQIPAGLLGSWLGRGRTAPVRYGGAVVVAGVLTLLLLWNLEDGGWDGVLPMWGDAVARAALGLGAYLWVVRPRAERGR